LRSIVMPLLVSQRALHEKSLIELTSLILSMDHQP
jgi:hypothetical protein